MANIRQKAILFLDKDKFDYYDEKIAKILSFTFPPEVVKYLEIINQDQLLKQVKIFIESNKLNPSSLLIIISNDLIFEKNFVKMEPSKKETEIQNFLDNIPFENISYKVFETKSGFLVVGVNTDIYNSIKRVFEAHQYQTIGIIPELLISQVSTSKHRLEAELIKNVVSKFEFYKQQSLVTYTSQKQNNEDYTASPQQTNQQQSKNHLPLLLGIFSILIAVLFFLIIQSNNRESKINPLPENIPTTNSAIISPSPVELPTITSATEGATLTPTLTPIIKQIIR